MYHQLPLPTAMRSKYEQDTPKIKNSESAPSLVEMLPAGSQAYTKWNLYFRLHFASGIGRGKFSSDIIAINTSNKSDDAKYWAYYLDIPSPNDKSTHQFVYNEKTRKIISTQRKLNI